MKKIQKVKNPLKGKRKNQSHLQKKENTISWIKKNDGWWNYEKKDEKRVKSKA